MSPSRCCFGKRRTQRDGYTSTTTEARSGICQPSNGQKWILGEHSFRKYLSHGSPAYVDLATEPWTSKRKTDLAVAVHSSVNLSQRASPILLAPRPQIPSRMKSTHVEGSPVGQCCWKSSKNCAQSRGSEYF